MLIVKTIFGSTYHICGDKVKRVECTHDMRRDTEWVTLMVPVTVEDIVIGQPLVMWLEPLGECVVTQRTTSLVVSVEETDD